MIGIDRTLPWALKTDLKDTEGCFLILHGILGTRSDIIIVGIYAPNECQHQFWEIVSSCFNFDKNHMILVLGDFNAVDNPEWDKSDST